MNHQNYSYELSTQETDISRSGDIENKSVCPFPNKGLPMPKGHEGYSESDKEKCPVMSGMIKAPVQGLENPEDLAQGTTKKKEKKPKGGCPFMASDNKKSPALELYPAAYEEKYVSAVNHLIRYKDTNSVAVERKWDNLPIFLKHTLFHDEEKLDKIRKLELGQRFFLYEQFREQANKSLIKGRIHEAIGLYEHALSCVKWLKYNDVQKQVAKKAVQSEQQIASTQVSQVVEEEEKEIQTSKTDKSNDGEESSQSEETVEEVVEEKEDPYKDLKPINKALLKPVTDENIEIFDGEELEDDADRDIRNAMLVSTYHGLAVCYLKLNHYTLALQAIQEGLKSNEYSSQLHYRRAEARVLNKGATLNDLLLAKHDIENAIEFKKDEKLFKNEPGILKMMNIHNADEAYRELELYIDANINEKRKENNENIRAILTKVREIEFLEDAFRKEGKKIPYESSQNVHALDMNNNDDDQMEWEVTNEMIKKYNKIIEFYQETERKDQVEIARKEIQTVLKVSSKMQFYRDLDFTNWEKDEAINEQLKDMKLDMNCKRVQERLKRFKAERSKEHFENGNFNLEVYQYALRDHLKRKEEQEQKAKKGKSAHDEVDMKKSHLQSLLGLDYKQILMAVFMLLVLWYLNKRNVIPLGLLWSDTPNKGSFA